jgi:hypothetical protein
LHDDAPALKVACVCQFFIPKNVTSLYHPPYFPNLSPPDYFLFHKLKIKLTGLHFEDAVEIQGAVTDELKKVQKEKLPAAFRKFCNSAEAYMYAMGAHFE